MSEFPAYQDPYTHHKCDEAAMEERWDDRCEGCKRVPITNQMDHTTMQERRKLVAMCENCGDWKYFLRAEHTQNTYKGLICDNCQGTKFRDVHSQRTFDPAKGKKVSAAWLKKRKK